MKDECWERAMLATGNRLRAYLYLAHHRLDDEEHVVWLGGKRCLPFCARCTAVYISFAAWLLLDIFILSQKYPDLYSGDMEKLLVVGLVLPFAVQWSWQTLSARRFSPWTRFLTGLLAGIPLAVVVLSRDVFYTIAAVVLIAYVIALRSLARGGGFGKGCGG